MPPEIGIELVVLAVAVASMVAGALPGAWVGLRGLERSRGHLWLAAIVGILAIALVAFYTIGGVPEELFSRVVMLPLSLLIAVAAVGVIVGIPMYASYLFAYRMTSYLSGKSTR
jgi:hypothetical protein